MSGATTATAAKISAVLDALPASATFKFARAAGVFAPLVPLLGEGPDAAPGRPCRISPAALAALWRWVLEEIEPDAARRLVRAFAMGAMGVPSEDAAALVGELRRKAGAGMRREFDAGRKRRASLVEALGGEAQAQEIGEAAFVLAHAEAIEQALPAPDTAAEPLSDAARAQFAAILEAVPSGAHHLVAALWMRRLDHPWEIVDAIAQVVRRRDQSRLDATAFAPALEALVDDVTLHAGEADSYDELRRDVARWRAVETALDGKVRDAGRASLSLGRARVREAIAHALSAAADRVRGRIDELVAPGGDGGAPALEGEPVAAGDLEAARIIREAEPLAQSVGADLAWRAAADRVEQGLGAAALAPFIAAVEAAAPDACDALRLRSDGLIALARAYLGTRAADALARRIAAAEGRPALQDVVFAPLAPMVRYDAGPRVAGRIGFGVLDDVWSWARDELADEEIAAADKRLQACLGRGGTAEFESHAVELRAVVGEAVTAARDPAAVDDGATVALPEAARAEAMEIGLILSAAPAIQEWMGDWPLPLPELTEPRLRQFRALFDASVDGRPERGPILLLFLIPRLAKPAQVLRALEWTTRHNSDIAVEVTDYGIVGDVLVDRAEACAAVFERAGTSAFDVDACLGALHEYAGLVSGMPEEFHIRRDGRWGKRLFSLRKRAARRLETICERAATLVEQVTPRTTTGRRGLQQPDVRAAPDLAKIAEATAYARFVAQARILDSRAAFAAAREKAGMAIQRRLDAHVDGLVSLARDADTSVSAAAVAHLRACAALVRGFEGDEAGELLLRRAAAAA